MTELTDRQMIDTILRSLERTGRRFSKQSAKNRTTRTRQAKAVRAPPKSKPGRKG